MVPIHFYDLLRHHENAHTSEAKKRVPVSQLPLKVSSLALMTQTEADMLAALCQDAGVALGRSISSSALTRALVRLADRGAIPSNVIIDEIETELNAGRHWGHDSTKSMAYCSYSLLLAIGG